MILCIYRMHTASRRNTQGYEIMRTFREWLIDHEHDERVAMGALAHKAAAASYFPETNGVLFATSAAEHAVAVMVYETLGYAVEA